VRPIRIAIVGLGEIARREHLPALRESDGFELAATVDPQPYHVDGVPHFSALSEMLELTAGTVDAVSICTPPRDRCEIASLALSQGLHVLLEKPPGTSLAECQAVASLAQESIRTLFAAWHSRFAGGVEPAREWLSSRTLRNVSITWHESVEKWHPGQSWIWQDGGFGVFDTGINALSIVTEILPQPLNLRSATLTKAEEAMPAAAELEFLAGEVPVQASFDWRGAGPEIWEIAVETDQGSLLLSRSGASLSTSGQRLDYENEEYARLYARFSDLILSRSSECDLLPLQLAIEALVIGGRPEIHD
jgi:D-galactose 1-dehydrogenase